MGLKANRVGPCSLCQHLIFYQTPNGNPKGQREWKKVRRQCFHEECQECAPQSTEALCKVCRHTRLGHIFGCGLKKIPVDGSDGTGKMRSALGLRSLTLRLGTSGEMKDRAERCESCRVFGEAMLRRGDVGDAENVYLNVSLNEGNIGEWAFEVTLSTSLQAQGLPSRKDDQPFNQENEESESYGDEEDDVSELPDDGYSFLATVIGPNWDERKLTLDQGPGETVDWNHASSWVKKCHADHQDTCPAPSLSSPVSGFRVIDVQRECVTSAPPTPCKYAALSYVWGQVSSETLQATTENISNLEEEGILSRRALPATIRDAIIACTELGIPYLWVDQLCILQDGKEEKLVQLNAMDKIYSEAYVTLVALAGDNALYGLPGVSQRQRGRYSITTQGIFLLEQDESYAESLEKSRWITRGWTYQEGLLSHRLLLFSDTGVFYECGHGSHVRDENPTLRKKGLNRMNDRHHKFRQDFPFTELVEDYTCRNLSFQSDILNAFLGALNARFGPDHYYGLPLAPFEEFNNAVIWVGELEAGIRKAQNGDIFPSWSWTSLQSGIFHEEQPAGSLALWAIAPADKDRSSLRVLNTSFMTQSKWKMEMQFDRLAAFAVAEAWKEGCLPGKLPDAAHASGSWKEQQNFISKEWPSLGHLCADAIGIGQGDSFMEQKFTPEAVDRARQPGRILIHTQSTPIDLLFPPELPTMGEEVSIRLKTVGGDILGCLIPHSGDIRKLWETYRSQSGSTFHALALSVSYKSFDDLESEDPYDNGSAFNKKSLLSRDSDGKALFIWDYSDPDVPDGTVGIFGDDAGSEYSDDEGHPTLGDFEDSNDAEDWEDVDEFESGDADADVGSDVSEGGHVAEDDDDSNISGDSEFSNHSFADRKNVDSYVAFTVNLMIVETQQDGVSRRVGLGRTFLKAWKNVNLQFETFILE
ncbi:hypothetical protein ANO14919_008400 [Xylariales sp. No.14919]|nr:hypothetical protein ANO14919_008400 [Xylariales sp. No.14919]